MALHHKLCHTLGGTFDLPHAETHTIILPHALAYNAPAVPDAMARIARAIGAADAAQGLYNLAKRLNAKLALRDVGMPESGIDKAADLAVTNAYWNPRPLERNAIRDLIARGLVGRSAHRDDSGGVTDKRRMLIRSACPAKDGIMARPHQTDAEDQLQRVRM